ncbi:MAG TPA: dienelactone hydrolase family protein [Gemmatimonadales bacterium]|nr:dienelactone hydrolase family protein [Gemmatimonadales bacterium]
MASERLERAALGVVAVLAMALPAWRIATPRTAPADIHTEYVKYLSGKDSITAIVAYPERKDAAPGVIVIHEIFGMSDFVKDRVTQLAKDGFVAIAPDLLSRRGGTPPTQDQAVQMIRGLNPDTLTQDLDATYRFLRGIRAVRADRIGVIGFCWGGGQSFRYATNNPELKGFVVCYGPGPDSASLARLKAPGLGVYAEKDARISLSVPATDSMMRKLGKAYQYRIYPGVGHGFIRSRDIPAVTDTAWSNIIDFFRAKLGS